MRKIVIAIDGYSSCGKSTMAKNLARKIGYTYIDTGAMYRAVTCYALQHGLFSDGKIDEKALSQAIDDIHICFCRNAAGQVETCLNGKSVEKEIRGMDVSNHVSQVAALGFVRKAMVRQQQEMGKEKGVVLDGRDIGSVVFPDAELKVFVTASVEVRAKRRLDELVAKGENATLEEVKKNIQMRDYIDSTRVESPLRKVDDAVVLDNSNMSIEEQDAFLLALYEERVSMF